MKLSRRGFLALGVGATQMALLGRYGFRSARAGAPSGGPTKLLTLYVRGGLSHEQIWGVLSDEGIARYIPAPTGNGSPYFYNAAMVKNYDGTTGNDGPYRKIRGPIWWNPDDPADNRQTVNPASGGTQRHVPWGYAWVTKQLSPQAVYERTAMIHGIDQGTAAHESGVVASFCGIAGGEFAAPAVPAVIANAMLDRFPDRALPSVAIGNAPAPVALSTPAHPMSAAVAPMYLNNAASLVYTISDRPDAAWEGLRTRTEVEELRFDGTPTGGTVPLTAVDAQVLKATRGLRGMSTTGTDAFLQEVHDTYAGASRSLARDLVDTITSTPGAEHLPTAMPWAPGNRRFGWTLGLADGGSDTEWDDRFDLALRLLKSDLTTSVTVRISGAENLDFDTHGGPSSLHINHLRGTFDVVARLIIEMMLTPSTTQPDKTLLDDTVVQIFSEFGRTFSQPTGGTDHHPATTMILIGGTIRGNRMIGGYDETIPGSPLGVPVEIINIEEGPGSVSSRVPRAADAAATVYRAFGLEAGRDFFIPGGYGEVKGVLDD